MSASKLPPTKSPIRPTGAPTDGGVSPSAGAAAEEARPAAPTAPQIPTATAPTVASSPGDLPAKPRMPPTIRAGMGDVTTEFVEIYSDEAEQRATGLLSILGADGHADPKCVPAADPQVWRAIYRGMVRVRRVDQHLTALAASGRIGEYADARGQEAAVVAPLAALADSDWIVPSHREGGAALFRGMSIRSYVAHAFGNANDIGKGRQSPAHPVTLRALKVLPASAASATKLPQATGLAWAAKIKKDETVVLAYLGEGATSAEDFHTGINFAAVFNVPAVFVCVNNGWSLSTPASAQSGAVTFAVKALAYGIPGIRVDGNDPLALYEAVRAAVERARKGEGPTFIEAVTYRLSGHTSADDGSSYRDAAEVESWVARDPLSRYSVWLNATGTLDLSEQARMATEVEDELRDAVSAESDTAPPSLDSLIEDVYERPPSALRQQLADLKRLRGK